MWSHIFSYACQDSGSTGCSLSLASKYIHETSKSVYRRSVAVCGITKIFRFYHLSISDDEPPDRNTRNTKNAFYTPPCGGPVSYAEPMDVMASDILRSNAISLLSLSIMSSCSSLLPQEGETGRCLPQLSQRSSSLPTPKEIAACEHR
ncbi:hypothetical protein BDM02DRAFT_3112139 [Thelephora ganbajun]|uniref:Uncharacterized protein n=1 Tax=Thelephora ganbajun TaxID=370292 RepID=A0ACB6ZLG7_THEGA|nr:hypothetical protein BDM02DRAFT_3112139 [Thelephora ganbajun]